MTRRGRRSAVRAVLQPKKAAENVAQPCRARAGERRAASSSRRRACALVRKMNPRGRGDLHHGAFCHARSKAFARPSRGLRANALVAQTSRELCRKTAAKNSHAWREACVPCESQAWGEETPRSRSCHRTVAGQLIEISPLCPMPGAGDRPSIQWNTSAYSLNACPGPRREGRHVHILLEDWCLRPRF
jgi:hypothetical protein